MAKIDIELFKKEIADYTNESGYVDIPLLFLLNTLSVVADGIVECKDCVHYGTSIAGLECQGYCQLTEFMTRKEDDFCSYGERKEVKE